MSCLEHYFYRQAVTDREHSLALKKFIIACGTRQANLHCRKLNVYYSPLLNHCLMMLPFVVAVAS